MQIVKVRTARLLKQWFDQISSDTSSLSRLVGLLLVGIAVALLIGLDPYLSTFVDEYYWSLMYLYDIPYKVSLVTAVFIFAMGIVIALAAKAREFRQIQIVAILISMQLVSIGAGGVDPIDLLTIASIALIIADALANPTRKITFPLLMYFALAIAILDLPTVTVDQPFHFVIGLIKYSKSAILPLILVYILSNDRLVDFFLKTLIAVAFVSACIGILQVVIFSLSGIPLVLVANPDDLLKPTPWGIMLRAHGLNPETHTLSTFLLIALPFALLAVTRAHSTLRTIFSGIVALTIMMGILLTWSYGGIIAVFLILGLFPLVVWPNKSVHYLLALLLIPVFLYATDLITPIYEMIRDEASMSTGIFQRKQLALIALNEIGRNPWIGHGFETVQFFSGNYVGRPVHNAYLQAWVATGPIGYLVFTFMMFIFTTSAFILGFSGNGDQEYRLRMITLVLVSFMVLMISEPAFFAASTWVALGIAQALILLHGRKHSNLRPTNSTMAIVGRAFRQWRNKNQDE